MNLGDEMQGARRAATRTYFETVKECEHRVTQQFAHKAI